jgi:hypothetical protein
MVESPRPQQKTVFCSLSSGVWTEDEDLELTRLFLTEGKKWSKISKMLGGARTEHMVKNRYKTIISRQKKAFPAIVN